ncbi:sialate O-acetylesterase [Aquibacillus halophilus]|uniref:Sialate O-acetylesterase n=1 Tax=Aquibacillus halophilus TaxID=930132 RepID=A0A6A8DCD5_9BACI|nr:sialate O-acetylesterase [Aquibacillus halophilus]MRH41441.1 sialate O-acetylesterase [Aquibacillus halophilus]
MTFSSLISDGMVLQRNKRIAIWGKTINSQIVEISFLGKSYQTESDSDGNWTIFLEDLKPGGPHQMEIIADEKTVINDILIGDVWVLGGQSNMEIPVKRTLDLLEDEVKTINHPSIRQFSVPQHPNFHAPQDDISGGKWIPATTTNVMDFSAAGYFFAADLYEKYQVPIGLILTAVGGTPIEAWMSEETLHQVGGYEATIEKNRNDIYVANTKRNDEQHNDQWYKNLNEQDKGLAQGWQEVSYDATEWQTFQVPNSWEGSELESIRGAVWFRKEIDVPDSMTVGKAKIKLGTIIDADDTYINGTQIGNTGYRYPPRRYTIQEGLLKPGKNVIAVRVISTQNTGAFVTDMPYKLISNGHELDLQGSWKYRVGAVTEEQKPQTFFNTMPIGLYNGMIAPIRNYAIKGVLWYQGESNSQQPKGYRRLFEGLVSDWRSNFNVVDLPFIFTQLANWDADPNNPKGTKWAELREEQRKGLAITNTGMAVAIDIGEHNDLHPQNKKTLGQRLALSAKKLVYGEDIVASGPIYNRMKQVGSSIHLDFYHVGSGLIAQNGQLKQFEISDVDGTFVPANAIIKDNKVIVTNEQVENPQHVRYAWLDNPAGANLYNKEGLPASPFTTE